MKMNSVSFRKTPVHRTKSANKRGRKRKNEKNSSVSRKSKKMKRNLRKSRKPSKMMEYAAEYENSGMDVSRSRQARRFPSDNSIIYVNTYHAPDIGIPTIDLTKSTHSIACSRTASLKLLYKSKNFNNRFQKRAAKSLLTIPLSNDVSTRNVNSTSNLTKSSKSILEIFPIYFDDDSDGSEALHDLSRPDLNEEHMGVGMRGDEEDPSFNLESKQPMENIVCQSVQSLGDGP